MQEEKVFVAGSLHLCKSRLVKVERWKIDLIHIDQKI